MSICEWLCGLTVFESVVLIRGSNVYPRCGGVDVFVLCDVDLVSCSCLMCVVLPGVAVSSGVILLSCVLA